MQFKNWTVASWTDEILRSILPPNEGREGTVEEEEILVEEEIFVADEDVQVVMTEILEEEEVETTEEIEEAMMTVVKEETIEIEIEIMDVIREAMMIAIDMTCKLPRMAIWWPHL